MQLAALLQRFAETAGVQLIILTRAGIERIGPEGLLCPRFDPSPQGLCMDALTSPKDEVSACGDDYQYITIRPPLEGVIQITLCNRAGDAVELKTMARLLKLQLQPYEDLGLSLPRRNPLSANLRTFIEGLVLLRELEECLADELTPDVFFGNLADYTRRATGAKSVVALWTLQDELTDLACSGFKATLGGPDEEYAGLTRLPTVHTPVKSMANKHLLRFEQLFGLKPQAGVGIRLHERAHLFCVWETPGAEESQLHRLEALQQRTESFTRRLFAHTATQWSSFLVVLSIVNALEARDTYSRGHSERVMRYAVRLGRAVGLSHREICQLRLAAVLHDIGKLGLAEEILGKDTPLDENDWVIVRRHPIVGEALVGVTDELGPVAQAIRAHHERWDGEGYPNRLEGEEIPLLSRILSIAEAFDAMTSERPFRHPLTTERATLELQGNAGQQFEPRLVELFIDNHCYREP